MAGWAGTGGGVGWSWSGGSAGGAGGGGATGGGAAADALRSWKPTASVRKSESGGCLAADAMSGSVIKLSTWLKLSAAAANSFRSKAPLACAYLCWMMTGSMRRLTSANAVRTRGDTSASDG
ncbi:MAG: hypothetical protein DMF92_09400 [Acidobacteria bacterium]|nr:MAG: hypothetical protein DMF92_09400 [Acidobacteriota bacterium]